MSSNLGNGNNNEADLSFQPQQPNDLLTMPLPGPNNGAMSPGATMDPGSILQAVGTGIPEATDGLFNPNHMNHGLPNMGPPNIGPPLMLNQSQLPSHHHHHSHLQEDDPKRQSFKRKRYKKELKAEVLDYLKKQSGTRLKYEDVAKQFGVTPSALRDWRRAWTKENLLVPDAHGPDAEEEEEQANEADSAEPKKKFKRKRYTTELKVEVLQFLKAHKACVNYEEVAKRFDVSVSALRDWRKSEDEIMRSVQEKRGNMKANPKYALKKLCDAVIEYWEANQLKPIEEQVHISMAAVQEKTREIRQKFLAQNEVQPFLESAELEAVKAFKASNTWAARIMKRIKRETKTLDQVKSLISMYKPQHVYAMDKSVLLFKALPIKSNGNQMSLISQARHMKSSDRITLYICANEDASHKVLPTVIGKSKTPSSFQKNLPYISQTHALHDNDTLRSWWSEIFLPAVRKRTSEPVVLVCSLIEGRDLVDPKGQVRVEVLPNDHTISSQPIAQGIALQTKKSFRLKLLRKILATFPDREVRRKIARVANVPQKMKGLSEGYRPNLSDVTRLVKLAWEGIRAEIIRESWQSTQLRPGYKYDIHENDRRSLDDKSIQDFQRLMDEARRSDESFAGTEADADAQEYEQQVLDFLLFATTEAGSILGQINWKQDLNSWCALEESPAFVEYLREEARGLGETELDAILPVGQSGMSKREEKEEDNKLGWAGSDVDSFGMKPHAIGPEQIEDCATDILTIATSLMRAQPELRGLAVELMEVPDKLLKARRNIKRLPETIPDAPIFEA